MSSTLLQIDKLQKSYGDHAALRDVSFSAQAGEFITILGRSGAVAQTTGRVLLLPEGRLRQVRGEQGVDDGTVEHRWGSP